jgi:hypothetical protein
MNVGLKKGGWVSPNLKGVLVEKLILSQEVFSAGPRILIYR